MKDVRITVADRRKVLDAIHQFSDGASQKGLHGLHLATLCEGLGMNDPKKSYGLRWHNLLTLCRDMQAMHNKPVILYAEDDLDDFETIKEALDQLSDDHTLVHARNGAEAVAIMEKGVDEPALVVLDLNMPLMDGKEVLRWMKAAEPYKNIPVMVFTTSSREEDVKICQEHGCTFYRKPTLYRDLLHVAQTMLDISHKKAV